MVATSQGSSDTRSLLSRVIASVPSIVEEGTQPDGDVIFSVGIREVGMAPEDLANPSTKTRFFVNFLGELIVRDHFAIFREILDRISKDEKLYADMVCSHQHADFGMIIDHEAERLRFTMHMSLIDQIAKEVFGGEGESLFDMEGSKPSSTNSEE